MRVALVTRIFPNSIQQWAGHSAYQTIRVLAQYTDLQVFYPYAVYPNALRRFDRSPKPDPTWQPEGVATTYIPQPALPGFTRHLNGHLIARTLLPYVRAFDPDVVLSYFIYPYGYAAVRIARALGVPAVLIAIGSDLHSIPDPLTRALTRSALRDADFVSAVSGDLCTLARTLGAHPARSHAELNGCDTTIFFPRDKQDSRATLSLDSDKQIVVYVGRLDVRKGLIELIEAAAQLRAARPNLRVYIVGDGPDQPALSAAIAAHNAGPWVTLVPSCPTDRVALWMAAADLVTLPSYKEGCPNVVIEALAAGRPVVATNVGGIPEIMDDTCGRMVPPRDVPALAQALDEVLSHSWDAQAISSKHGRSWSDVAVELHTVLTQSIVAHRPNP